MCSLYFRFIEGVYHVKVGLYYYYEVDHFNSSHLIALIKVSFRINELHCRWSTDPKCKITSEI